MEVERRRLAAALSDALLAGEWTVAGFLAAARTVLGTRRRWVRRLAVEVLAAYPRPPLDRPREFAVFVAATAALAEVERRASRSQRPMPRVVRRVTTTTVMTGTRFNVPRVDNAGDLADLLGLSMPELLWFGDTKGYQRRSNRERLQHYGSRWVPTRSGGVRLLEAPRPRLRTLQRQVLDDLLGPVPVHPAAHGFVTGRSVLTGALPHVGAEVVITLDLESFFASIGAERVYGVLRSIGYPEPVSHLLTGLCTQATPFRVLADMPRTAAHFAPFRLRRRLATAHLPQGSPTSPQLANLCAFSLDRRLSAYAAAIGATYTRYADDLTFSGSGIAVRQRGVVAAVSRIAVEEGFAVNRAKTRVQGRDGRQQVTGVVVNTATRIPREEYDLLRAILHNCVTHGPDGQNRLQHRNFRAHLLGRIAWVAFLDAERGRRLRTTFDRIVWN